MPDVREFQVVVDEAEQAARAGDFARADERLREALGLQEASLGVDHPSLASTLNNLAVVCETRGRIEDAERFYRRAYAVASAALPPSDPLVVTSRENLLDFCAARELPEEDWPGLDQAEGAPAPGPRTPPAPAAAPAPRLPATAQAVAAPPRSRRALGAVAALAVLGAIVAAVLWRGTAPVPPPPAQTTVAAPAPEPAPPARLDTPAAPAEPVPLARPPVTAATAPDPAPAMPLRAEPAPAAPRAASGGASAPSTAARPDDVRLVVADVCASLTTSGAWRCERLGAAPAPGRAAFYTRIASPRPLRVEHRWYQGAALRQRVTLSVGASPSAGYRTFSRQTLTAGAWRVELRAADGTVLHEAAFDVR